jgi:hypothetical protein
VIDHEYIEDRWIQADLRHGLSAVMSGIGRGICLGISLSVPIFHFCRRCLQLAGRLAASDTLG